MLISETGWPNLFKLVFEKNPLALDTDFKLNIKLLPVQIYYNEEVCSELMDFLFLPEMDCLELTWGFLYQGYKYGQQFKRFIKNCLTSRIVCDLNIDLQNPCIQIGQYGKSHNQGANLIVDCGRLLIESAMVNNENSTSSSPSLDSNSRKVYDEFIFSFSGIQVVQIPSKIAWCTLKDEPSSEYHIVPKTKMQLTLSTSVLQTQEIPAWKLDIFIKCAKINLSDSKLSYIIDFLRDLPLPSRNRNMKKNSTNPLQWKIDKKWAVPSIGKLELLYLENQLAEQEQLKELSNNSNYQNFPVKNFKETDKDESEESSSDDSVATDTDIKNYCREIDLPGFQDNISPDNKLIAVIQVCIKDAGLIFDRASGSVDKSYLYLGASDINFDIGLMEQGPAIEFGVGSAKMMDRQAGVDLVSLTPSPGQEQVSGNYD